MSFEFPCSDLQLAGSCTTGKLRLMGNLCSLAKHCVDWSYRQRNVYVISVATILRQGYNAERFRQALRSEAEWVDEHAGLYCGSDGSGGVWRVHVTYQS